MEWVSIVSLVIACLSAAATLYVWVTHGRKINKFQLDKLKKEQEEEKKACMRGNFIKNKGIRTLKVFNSGKAEALNIKVDFLDDITSIMNVVNAPPMPYEKLSPQDSFEIRFTASSRAPGTPIRIRFSWDDEYGMNRENIHVIQA